MQTPNHRDERRAREIERTRQDILEAAGRVFARGGFQSATMQAIAREAGFTAASLYTYFQSKEAIFDGLREDIIRRIHGTFELPAPAGLTFAQRLELLLQRQLTLISERMDALRVFFERPPALAEERATRSAMLDDMERFLQQASGEELRLPAREAALVLTGLLHSRVIGWIAGDEAPDPAQLASRVVDIFLHGAARPAVP